MAQTQENFDSPESVQNSITRLKELLDQAKGNKPSGKGGNISSKSAEAGGEAAQKEIKKEEVNQVILNKLANKQTNINTNAKYFKPAFLLNTLTPFLRITLQTYNFSGELVQLDLFDDTKDPSYNYLRSFKYDMTEKGEFTIELVDADQTIVEFLTLKFTQLQKSIMKTQEETNVTFLIEYGWHVPPDVKEGYEGKVIFTRSVIAKLLKVETKYDSNGVINATISGVVDETLFIPYTNFKPYMVLGRAPAVNLVVILLLQFIEAIMRPHLDKREWRDDPESPNGEKNTVYAFARYLYFELDIKDVTTIKALIKSVIKYHFNVEASIVDPLTAESIEGTIGKNRKIEKNKKMTSILPSSSTEHSGYSKSQGKYIESWGPPKG